MFSKALPGLAGALAASALLLGANAALAHTIVGDRVFPATLTIDDPGVNDELALPAFSYQSLPNGDGTYNYSTSLTWEYAKTITSDLGISVGNGVTFQRNPQATGWSNLETQLKYVLYQNLKQELIFAAAVNVEIGHTGSPPGSALPADPYSTITGKLYFGKGFGDAPADWLRPFAITGEVDFSNPTTNMDSLGNLHQTYLTWGGSLQYSLLYQNSYVSEVPDVFKKLIPSFEAILTTPVSWTGPSVPSIPGVHETTGVVGPSLYYIGQYFEIGVMAQIPVNSDSGKHLGALAVLDFFLDDIAPDSIGKPLFGATHTSRY
jgi:hypothetical protein